MRRRTDERVEHDMALQQRTQLEQQRAGRVDVGLLDAYEPTPTEDDVTNLFAVETTRDALGQ